MRVVLLKDVPALGVKGATKEVSDGYARNFLLPKNLAALATPGLELELKKQQAQKSLRAEADLQQTQELAEKLQTVEVVIKGKTNEVGTLYAKILPGQIASLLKKQGCVIKKEQVFIMEPIKEVGDYRVLIKLPHNLESEVTVIVTE
ncbi:MAG: 50S ribosomal protein L9 [Candidatus Buchananbacteria bacterium]